MKEKRREFTRASVRLSCTLYTSIGPIEGFIDNVSLRGVYVETSLRPEVGSSCSLFIRLASGGCALSIRIAGTITRHGPDGVGVCLDQLAFESFEHLSRLVLLNSDDPDKVQSEMEEHLGIRPRTGSDDTEGMSQHGG